MGSSPRGALAIQHRTNVVARGARPQQTDGLIEGRGIHRRARAVLTLLLLVLLVLPGCMSAAPQVVAPRPKDVSRVAEPLPSPPMTFSSSKSSPAAPLLVPGEPVVGFDGQRLETAFYAPVSVAVKNDRFD